MLHVIGTQTIDLLEIELFVGQPVETVRQQRHSALPHKVLLEILQIVHLQQHLMFLEVLLAQILQAVPVVIQQTTQTPQTLIHQQQIHLTAVVPTQQIQQPILCPLFQQA